MPVRTRAKIYHTSKDSFTKESLVQRVKEILATYAVTLSDLMDIFPLFDVHEVLFADIYINGKSFYLVTNCLFMDDHFTEDIKNESCPYQLFQSLGVSDVEPEVVAYKQDPERIKQSVLLFLLVTSRSQFDTTQSWLEFYQETSKGKQIYDNLIVHFREKYSK